MTGLAEQDAGPVATWSFPAIRALEGGWWLGREWPASYAMKDVGPCLHGPMLALLRY